MATLPEFRFFTIAVCFSFICTDVLLYLTYSKLTRKPLLKFNNFESSAFTAGILMDPSHKVSHYSDKLTAKNGSYHSNETNDVVKREALQHDKGNSSITFDKLPVPIEPSYPANETLDKTNSLKNDTVQMTTNWTNDRAKPNETINFVKNGIFINTTVNNIDSFKYVYPNSDLCYQNVSDNEGVFLLVMVLTAPAETDRRNLIRGDMG